MYMLIEKDVIVHRQLLFNSPLTIEHYVDRRCLFPMSSVKLKLFLKEVIYKGNREQHGFIHRSLNLRISIHDVPLIEF